MSIAGNKRAVEELYRDIYGRADFSRLTELVSPDFVNGDTNGGQHADREGIAFLAALLHDCFEDFRCTVHELIAEDENVVARVTFEGVHRKEFLGVPPSHRANRTDIIAIWRFRDGRIVGLNALRRMSCGQVH